jgi:DNA helicase-2/ATP-dependent DNA helicase PcrA
VQLLPGIGGKGADRLWKEFSSRETGEEEGKSEGRNPKAEARGPNPELEKAQLNGLKQDLSLPISQLAVRLQRCASSVPRKAAIAWAQLVSTVAQLDAEEVRGNASKMLRLVIEAGYEEYLEENFANHRSRLEDLEQLAVFAQQFPTMDDFLTQLALLTNVEADDDRPAEKDEEQLRLSTIHQAKGLEFDVVFIIMLCDGLFPSARSLESADGEEEERRLMYVAITRARDELYLSYPLIRASYGNSGDLLQHPSRFLQEIPKELIEEWNLRTYA